MRQAVHSMVQAPAHQDRLVAVPAIEKGPEALEDPCNRTIREVRLDGEGECGVQWNGHGSSGGVRGLVHRLARGARRWPIWWPKCRSSRHRNGVHGGHSAWADMNRCAGVVHCQRRQELQPKWLQEYGGCSACRFGFGLVSCVRLGKVFFARCFLLPVMCSLG